MSLLKRLYRKKITGSRVLLHDVPLFSVSVTVYVGNKADF
jgi:hypothetical protein